ncbi:MAG: hypothetical protein ACKVX7_14475 [Planctomycetota bacterium]
MLETLRADTKVKHAVIVTLERQPRRLESGTEILPWSVFLERLWNGDFD